jgi:hypothetical protein
LREPCDLGAREERVRQYTFQRCTSQGIRLLFHGDVGGLFLVDEVHSLLDPGFLVWN